MRSPCGVSLHPSNKQDLNLKHDLVSKSRPSNPFPNLPTEKEKMAAIRESNLTKDRLRTVQVERDRLLSSNTKLRAEKDSLMMDVSV